MADNSNATLTPRAMLRPTRTIIRTALLAAAWLPLSITAPADENWSRFRGPNGAGVSDAPAAFPASWSEDDYLWRIDLAGRGHSSPIGWGELLFVTAAHEQAGELTLLAIDAATGKTQWSRSFAAPPYRMHGMNSLASSTPAADAERVYLALATPESLEMAALDHQGREAWRHTFGPVDYKHGFGVSPIVVDGLVIMACDHSAEGFVAALDVATGQERWRRPRNPGTESYATPTVRRAPGRPAELIVASTAEGLSALSLESGDQLWNVPDVFTARCVASLVTAGGLVIGASGEGGNGRSFTAVHPPQGAGEPQVAYALRTSIPQVPTPIAVGDLLFVLSDRGVVTCCDLETGAVHWTERIGGNFASSPVAAGGVVYATASDGQIIAFAADKRYKRLGRSDLGDRCQATPAIHRGRMYFRTEATLACLPASK